MTTFNTFERILSLAILCIAVTAIATCPACVTRVNAYYLTTSILSFVGQDTNELRPSSVGDVASQSIVPEHPLDIQALNSNDAISINQVTSDLVLHILSGVCGFSVQGRDTLFHFGSSIRTFAASGQRTLPSAKFTQVSSKGLRIAEKLAVACGGEASDSDINANLPGFGGWREIWKFDTEANEPLPVLSNNPCLLEFCIGRYLAMPPNANRSNVLKSKFPINNLDSSTVASHGVGEGIELIGRFESRVTGSFSVLCSIEESVERPLESFQCLLGRPVVQIRVEPVSISFMLQPSTLFKIAEIDLILLPDELLCFKHLVVQPAVSFKTNRQFTLLIGVREKSKFVSLNHSLASLIIDVSTNCRLANVPNCPCVVASSPERRNSTSKCFELLPENSGTPSLEPVNYFSDRDGRVCFDEQMNVVWHDFMCMNCPTSLTTNFEEQFLEPCFDFTNQNVATVLRAPNKVVLETKHGRGVFGIGVHSWNYTDSRCIVKKGYGDSPTS